MWMLQQNYPFLTVFVSDEYVESYKGMQRTVVGRKSDDIGKNHEVFKKHAALVIYL
jgi:hypothetical protein